MYEFLTLIHKQKTLTQASSHTINVRFCMEIDQSVDRLKYFYICVAMEFHYLTLRESSKNCHVILRSTRMKTSKLISLCAYESFESLIPHIFHSAYMLSVHCLLNFFCGLKFLIRCCDHKRDKTETKRNNSRSLVVRRVAAVFRRFGFCFLAFSFVLSGVCF